MALPVLTEREAGAYSLMFLRSTATAFMSCWCGVRSCFAATPTPGGSTTWRSSRCGLPISPGRSTLSSLCLLRKNPIYSAAEETREVSQFQRARSRPSTAGRPHWRLCSVISAFRGSRNVLRSCLRRFARLFRSERGGVFP